MTAEEEGPNVVISSTLLLEEVYVHVLFDPRATHSFVTLEMASKLSYVPIEIDYGLFISTPIVLVVTFDVMS